MPKGELFDIVGQDNVESKPIPRKSGLRGYVTSSNGLKINIAVTDRLRCILSRQTLYIVGSK